MCSVLRHLQKTSIPWKHKTTKLSQSKPKGLIFALSVSKQELKLQNSKKKNIKYI